MSVEVLEKALNTREWSHEQEILLLEAVLAVLRNRTFTTKCMLFILFA